MKVLVLLLFVACVVFASIEEDRQQWLSFKSTHGKFYQNHQEENLRFSIFQHNLRTIEEHMKKYEAGETTYTLKITGFADLTKEEFITGLKQQHLGHLKLGSKIYDENIFADAPESIDWREKGAVSEVRDQGTCGASWVFSVTGTLEGFNFVKTNQLVTLSGQQIIDCAFENGGCTGGDESNALEYVKEHGIETEDSYPYGGDLTCRYNESAVFLRVQDFTYIKSQNEKDLLSAVGLLGPVSVEIDASYLAFYEGGVYSGSDCSQDNINHAVLAVGYAKDETTDYWIIKNSWGKSWGENGYFRIKRGVNECGIASYGVYPVLD